MTLSKIGNLLNSTMTAKRGAVRFFIFLGIEICNFFWG